MNYIEVNITLHPETEGDFLIALLAEIGFESFTENENGFDAFIPEKNFDPAALDELLAEFSSIIKAYQSQLIPDQNWNAVWESNFQPVVIHDTCLVRAPFHSPQEAYPFEIIIEPKMSFGTAHHPTTSGMICLLFEQNILGKNLLDMGCGTGILAICAEKLGAASVVAIDNDEWAFENTLENIERNNCKHIETHQGDASLLHDFAFDGILANINRNILLNDLPSYAQVLKKDGFLIMSGFYTEDLESIRNCAQTFGLIEKEKIVQENWVAVKFQR